MRRFLAIFVVGVAVMLGGCGNDSGSATSLNGTWNATFTTTTGPQVPSFSVVLTQSSNSSNNVVNITDVVNAYNFKFTTAAPLTQCFTGFNLITGTVGVSSNGITTDIVGEGFTLTIQSDSASAVLSLGTPSPQAATVTSSTTISGTYIISGSCTSSGTGSFTMTLS